MTTERPPTSIRSERNPDDESLSAASLVGFPLLVAGLLVGVSYPFHGIALLVAIVVAAKTVQVTLATVVDRIADRTGEFAIPGVATVSVRITPN